MADPAIPKIPKSDVDRINAIVGRISDMGKGAKNSSFSMAGLNKIQKKYTEDIKRSRPQILDLGKAVKILGTQSKLVSETVKKMADDFASDMDTMSTAQKEAFEKTLDNIKAAEGSATTDRDKLIFAEKARQMEVGKAKDILQQQVLAGKNTKGIVASLNGVFAKARMGKLAGAEKIGNIFGMTGKSMAKLTGGLLGLGLAAAFANKVLKSGAKGADNAAKSFMDLGDNMNSVQGASDDYRQAIIDAGFSSGMSKKQIEELTHAFTGELGTSITKNISESALLAKQLGGVDLSFGVAANESVKLGAKLGVLGRADAKNTGRAFVNLGEQAVSLGVGIEHLMDPMMEITEISGAAGAGMMDAVMGFNAIVNSANALSTASGPFNEMFATMSKASKAGAIQRFASSFSKIDDIQWAAFSQKKGEGFFDTVGRLSSGKGAGATAKLGYMDDLAKKLGIDRMKNDVQKEYTMGSVLSKGALTGDFKAARELGLMALNARKQGKAFDETAATGRLLDEKFGRKESIGQYVAGGGDVMQFMANKLEILVEIATKWFSAASTFYGRFVNVPGLTIGGGGTEGAGYGSSASSRQKGPVSKRPTANVR